MEQVAVVCEMVTQVWSCLSDLKSQQQKGRQEVPEGASPTGS